MGVWDVVGPVLLLGAAGLTGTIVWQTAKAKNRARVADAEARKWEAIRKTGGDV